MEKSTRKSQTTKTLAVPKTIKLFIGGDFPRTESGRSFPIFRNGTEVLFANLCRASRKDLRNAVSAALGAKDSWEQKSAYNRSQILYRMAEMLEGKRLEVSEILISTTALKTKPADLAVDEAIDAFIYYSGFADKFHQAIGSVNPVSGPHHCFTTPEPVGVVALICDDDLTFGRFIAAASAIIASGNSLVALLPQKISALAGVLGEVFATSDLPKGTINLLTGISEELLTHFGSHMEIHSISYQGRNSTDLATLKKLAADNMKRVVSSIEQPLALSHLLSFVEYKTVWHPIGH